VKLVELPLAFRFLRGQYGRLALTVVALSLGVALVCAILVVNRAVLRSFTEVIDTLAGRAALQVTAPEGATFPEDVATKIAAVPNVELAVPVVSVTASTTDEPRELVTVFGVDITNDVAVRTYEARDDTGSALEDPLVFLSRPDSILLTRRFAAPRHLAVGDRLQLDTPSGPRWFAVRGLIEPRGVGRIHGGNLVVMDIAAAEATFTRPRAVNRIDVVVPPDADLEAVRRAIAEALPEGLGVTAPEQRKVDLNRLIRSVQVGLQQVALLGMVAAFLIMFNRLTTSFEARAWQLGVMRAMGVTPWAACRELLNESALLGALGVGIGLPLGVGIARLMMPVITTMTAVGTKLTIPAADFSVDATSLAVAAGVGFAAALLAAALPAWRAAYAPVAGVVRSRGAEQLQRAGRVGIVAIALRVLTISAAAVAIALEVRTGAPMWGLIATFLLVTAPALLARPIVVALSWAGLRRLSIRADPRIATALASLLRNPRRTGLTLATFSVGFGVVTWLLVLTSSIERSVVSILHGLFQADLAVSSIPAPTASLEAPMDERVSQDLADVAGIAAVVGEQVSDWHYAGGPIALNAYDARFFTDPMFQRWSLVGRSLPSLWDGVADGRLALISSNFSHNLGLKVGDDLTLDSPSGPLRLTVGGVVHTFLSPRGTVVMARELYGRYWNDPHITHAFIRVRPGADVDRVREAISSRMAGRYRVRVLTVGELVDWLADQVRGAFAGLYALAAMVLFVVAVGVADTLAAGTLERRREFATMGALGVSPAARGAMVLIEACILAGLGIALALVTGLALGVLWVTLTFPDLVGFVLQMQIPVAPVVLTIALALAVCLGAGLSPARRSMRLPLGDALRYE
jgi:putative ABC transport system permease protein